MKSEEEKIVRIKSKDGEARHLFNPLYFGIEIVSMQEDEYGRLKERRYVLKSSSNAIIYTYEEVPE